MTDARPERIADYFATVSVGEVLTPFHIFQSPIYDICLVLNKDSPPFGYERIECTVLGHTANLTAGNANVFSPDLYLSYTRIKGSERKRRKAAMEDKSEDGEVHDHHPHPTFLPLNDSTTEAEMDLPLSDIIVLYPDKGEHCPPTYVPVIIEPILYNKPSNYGRTLLLAVSRTPTKPPIYDMVALSPPSPSSRVRCPHPYKFIRKPISMGTFYSSLYLGILTSPTTISQCTFRPQLLDRYPRADMEDSPLPDGIPYFANPEGLIIYDQPIVPDASVHTFVMTTINGVEMYGTAVTFYERINIIVEHGTNGSAISYDPPSASPHSSVHPLSPSSSSPTLSTYGRSMSGNLSTSGPNLNASGPGSTESLVAVLSRSHYRSICSNTALLVDPVTRFIQPQHQFYAPKTIIVLSQWPYYECFKTFLIELWRLHQRSSPILKSPLKRSQSHTDLLASGTSFSSEFPHNLPLERLLQNLWECPLPLSSRVAVRLKLPTSSIVFARTSAQQFPLLSFNFSLLFHCLSLENIFMLFSALLNEKKIILISTQFHLLTPIAEALRSLLFPFQWQYAFVPLLPSTVTTVFDAPMPILVGSSSPLIAQRLHSLEDICVVNLDTNEVKVVGKIRMIPETLLQRLQKDLENYAHVDQIQRYTDDWQRRSEFSINADTSVHHNADISPTKSKPTSFSSTISGHQLPIISTTPTNASSVILSKDSLFSTSSARAAFLHLFLTLLGNFDEFLKASPEDPESKQGFDVTNFLAKCPRPYAKFLKMFCSTQMFSHFVEEKIYSSSRKLELEFFDHCAKYEKELRLAIEVQKLRRTMTVLPPNLLVLLSQRIPEAAIFEAPTPDLAGLTSEHHPARGLFPILDDLLFTELRTLTSKYLHYAEKVLNIDEKQSADTDRDELHRSARNTTRTKTKSVDPSRSPERAPPSPSPSLSQSSASIPTSPIQELKPPRLQKQSIPKSSSRDDSKLNRFYKFLMSVPAQPHMHPPPRPPSRPGSRSNSNRDLNNRNNKVPASPRNDSQIRDV